MECSKPSLACLPIARGFLISLSRMLSPLSTPLTTIFSKIPREGGTWWQDSRGEGWKRNERAVIVILVLSYNCSALFDSYAKVCWGWLNLKDWKLHERFKLLQCFAIDQPWKPECSITTCRHCVWKVLASFHIVLNNTVISLQLFHILGFSMIWNNRVWVDFSLFTATAI